MVVSFRSVGLPEQRIGRSLYGKTTLRGLEKFPETFEVFGACGMFLEYDVKAWARFT